MKAVYNHANNSGKPVLVLAGSALTTAEDAYGSMPPMRKETLDKAAETAIKLILPLEPTLMHGHGDLLLQIASDSIAIGANGDVRDVFCIRDDEQDWKIGFSCKHNHEALRHPRITEGLDFGWDWVRVHCSRNFIDEMSSIIEPLKSYQDSARLWREIPGKTSDYYVPILDAYKDEIARLCVKDPDVPSRLLGFFFGANDFYKIIMRDKDRTTTIECFNMNGTLGRPCGSIKPLRKIARTPMPSRLIDIASSPKSHNAIVLTFDEGWAISMRLHNKDSIAKPTSLAWDVTLVGLPQTMYTNTHYWDE